MNSSQENTSLLTDVITLYDSALLAEQMTDFILCKAENLSALFPSSQFSDLYRTITMSSTATKRIVSEATQLAEFVQYIALLVEEGKLDEALYYLRNSTRQATSA